MARRLRSVELDFVDAAPLRLVFAAEVSAAPGKVYRALADDVPGWPGWFTAVTAARPTEGGAGREVRLKGGFVIGETILAAEPGERYAYRADRCNAPGCGPCWRSGGSPRPGTAPGCSGRSPRTVPRPIGWSCGWPGRGWAGLSGPRCGRSTGG